MLRTNAAELALRFSALQRAENSSNQRAARCQMSSLCFSALQRAENSSNKCAWIASPNNAEFQCSSASRKFLKAFKSDLHSSSSYVSVLFSEPKIPQSPSATTPESAYTAFQCSSASRKFLNRAGCRNRRHPRLFQCSSASRKFLNRPKASECAGTGRGFSALQRAENSSMMPVWVLREPQKGFSALQRAENSSMYADRAAPVFEFLFQCSSASRKFLNRVGDALGSFVFAFQCSSASRKFLNSPTAAPGSPPPQFQCSSASRKFLNPDPRTCVHPYSRLRRSRFVVPEPSWCVAMTPVY